MNCTRCDSESKVTEKRGHRRRRECLACGFRFSTMEVLAAGQAEPMRKPPAAPRKIAATPRKPKPAPKTSPVQEKVRRASVRSRIEDMNDRRSAYDDFDFLPDA